jgi:enoyl-CoA hydratase/carnithine racemase
MSGATTFRVMSDTSGNGSPQSSTAAPALVELERRSDGVALIRLANGKLNPLSQAVLRKLHDVLDELRTDLPGAVVVTGNDRAFAAGADISEFGGPDEARTIGDTFTGAFNALAAFPRVTIAAVNGFALGGGCELALACDLRIAGERAKFGQPEILLGIIPGGGGTQRLARLVGPSRAKDLILTGRQVDAAEASAIGLVDEVVADDAVLDRALGKAAELAKGAVIAQAMAKHAIDHGLDRELTDGIILEQELFVEVFKSKDARTGVASFREHGPGKATFAGE